MKCAHCLSNFHDNKEWHYLKSDPDGHWAIEVYTCANPECRKINVFICSGNFVYNPQQGVWQSGDIRSGTDQTKSRTLIRPRAISRSQVPDSVPDSIKEDYNEACNVLADSAKASAALSRRCLQQVLRLSAGVKKGDLADEIQEVLNSNKLPTLLAKSIDAIRNIGNFAAHPNKNKITGEILPVEPDEAEWNLDVLEILFDFYYVQPDLAQ